jgi:hypothetical protein
MDEKFNEKMDEKMEPAIISSDRKFRRFRKSFCSVENPSRAQGHAEHECVKRGQLRSLKIENSSKLCVDHPGTDVMILKIFSPKKLAFFAQTTASF